jgi:hypothetical protein
MLYTRKSLQQHALPTPSCNPAQPRRQPVAAGLPTELNLIAAAAAKHSTYWAKRGHARQAPPCARPPANAETTGRHKRKPEDGRRRHAHTNKGTSKHINTHTHTRKHTHTPYLGEPQPHACWPTPGTHPCISCCCCCCCHPAPASNTQVQARSSGEPRRPWLLSGTSAPVALAPHHPPVLAGPVCTPGMTPSCCCCSMPPASG